ncbi:MAG: bifunctional precorrin-2 dehydrogenase/sirohydrochlorin ferrochelatase [Actinobacteria bacterium]|nr:bifunctional precorrin-2 dehydrogenase/sirohydrochlorin ferrochelatase [Actinomycetota bacterium]
MPVERPLYPANLVVAGRAVLVVGAGAVAARKVAELLACEADVTVVAPEADPAIAADPRVRWERRAYRDGDLEGRWLAFTCTGDPGVDGAVFAEGERRGVWVNSADDPARCSFTLPSRVRRGDLLVTVSTAGRSPALAAWLRARLGAELGPEYAVLLDLLSEAREAVRATGRSTEGLDWNSALEGGMLDLVREGRTDEARELLRTCLSSSSD